MSPTPTNGDVLVTKRDGRYIISLVLEHQQISLVNHEQAMQVASKWASVRRVRAWQLVDDVPRLLQSTR